LKVPNNQTGIQGQHHLHHRIPIMEVSNQCFWEQTGEMEQPKLANSAFERFDSQSLMFQSNLLGH
jgi:hypothetical protein